MPVVIFPPMASSFMTRSDLLCSIASSIQSSRRDFVDIVRGGRVSWDGRVSRQKPGVVCMAASKQQQKKKIKEKRKAGGGRGGRTHGWSFDALMLVWDEVFDRCCEDGERAGAIRALGKKGLERKVRLRMRTGRRDCAHIAQGSASGFSNHARHSSSKDIDEPPAYETLKWTAQYVPRTFVFNPSLAPEAAAADSIEGSMVDVTNQVIEDVPLVTREVLFSVLRGMDRTRIVGLTGDDISSVAVENGPTEPMAPDAGGEEPYNPRNEEIVLMLVVMVDGQPAVGADVVKALPSTEDGQELWKLEMRDFHTLPIPV